MSHLAPSCDMCPSCYVRDSHIICFIFFFFNDTATTEIYTLSLHDALPNWVWANGTFVHVSAAEPLNPCSRTTVSPFPRSEEHTSEPSHVAISYAVFCLKKKKKKNHHDDTQNETRYNTRKTLDRYDR